MALTDSIDLTDDVAGVPEWSLGDRLTKSRKHAGIKQQSTMAEMISDRLGREISGSAVGAWERGTNQPGDLLDVIRAWSEITGVPQDWLLGLRTGRYRALSAVASIPGPLQLELPIGCTTPALTSV